MKVLVVSKKTNLELHGELIHKRVQAGLIDPFHFKILEKTHEEHYQTLHTLFETLTRYKVGYVSISRGLFWPNLKDFDAVLTVGGDGTVLEASRHILDSRILLVGIRSALSSIGKLCHSQREHLEELVKNLSLGKIKALSVFRMHAKILSIKNSSTITTEPVLNDFLYSNVSPAATTRYKLTLQKKTQEQRSSGVWISTPCGSTAAISAAGGKKMDLRSSEFQFLVRELYDYYPFENNSPLSQGILNSAKEALHIQNLTESAFLACDGLHGTYPLGFGDQISFLKSPDLNIASPDYYNL